MKIYEAINEPDINILYDPDSIKVFLAGGITKCEDWQSLTIEGLTKFNLPNLLVFNPRRSNFDVTDPFASQKQIEWEFKYLNNMDIFTMYFANSESVQPICMYELGRHIERMMHRFPSDWKNRIIIGIEKGYSRTQDVIIQTKLAFGNLSKDEYDRIVLDNADITNYTLRIAAAYSRIGGKDE